MRRADVWTDGHKYTIPLEAADVRYLQDHQGSIETVRWLITLAPEILGAVWETQVTDIWVQDGFPYFCVWGPVPV